MKPLSTTLLFFIITISTINAQNNNYSKWSVRLNAVNVLTSTSDAITDGEFVLGNSFGFEIGLKYFFTKNISTEFSLMNSKHKSKIQYFDFEQHRYSIGDVNIIPLNLNFQYNFILNDFHPYVGIGINYTFFYVKDEDIIGGVHGGEFDNALGFTLQGGIAYEINKHWFVNFDVKQMFISTDMTTYRGWCDTPEKNSQIKTAIPCPDYRVEEVKTKVNINPLSLGLGVGYTFK